MRQRRSPGKPLLAFDAHPHTQLEYQLLLGLLTAQGRHREARELKAAFKK